MLKPVLCQSYDHATLVLDVGVPTSFNVCGEHKSRTMDRAVRLFFRAAGAAPGRIDYIASGDAHLSTRVEAYPLEEPEHA
jgi:hypothetical protein